MTDFELPIAQQKTFLEFNVIWRDNHMLEIKVTASNGRFLGTTQVYDTSDS